MRRARRNSFLSIFRQQAKKFPFFIFLIPNFYKLVNKKRILRTKTFHFCKAKLIFTTYHEDFFAIDNAILKELPALFQNFQYK